MTKDDYEKIGSEIISASYEVHKELGPGLLESVYEQCLTEELKQRNIMVASQVRIPLVYKGKSLNKEFIVDLLVENMILIELKSVEKILPVHEVQIVTYLKLSGLKLGYLINFNEALIKNGMRRKVNNFFR